MKTFHNEAQLTMWMQRVLDKGALKGMEIITEDLYKWSKPYTYYLTGQTYGDKGAPVLDFKHGLIIQKSPQVRKLYYMGGTPNAQHPGGQPRWWEVTKRVHREDMIKQAKKILGEEKRK